MKRRLIALVLASATVAVSLGISTGVTVKADSFIDVYEQTYDLITDLQDLGKKYHITPRLKNNGSKMEDNKLEDVVAGSKKMQESINYLREYQQMFPNEYWKARNTFSEIGDSYQQPIYEWIVDIAVRLQKQVKDINNIQKDKLDDFIANAEQQLKFANILNEGVDPAYRGAYQAALDNIKVDLDKLKESLGKKKNGWIEINNRRYFYKNGDKVTGWLSDGDNWYYLGKLGAMYSERRVKINGNEYYFDANGKMHTGWMSLLGSEINQPFDPYIYFGSDGKIVSGWRSINGSKYYFSPKYDCNFMATGWNKIDGKEYYFTESGKMVQGSVTIDGKVYNFANSGEFLGLSHPKTGWMLENDDWYFYIDGVKQKGWLKHNNNWYFLNDDGKIQRGWLNLNGVSYWFGDDGIMADHPIDINGVLHNFNKNGAFINKCLS